MLCIRNHDNFESYIFQLDAANAHRMETRRALLHFWSVCMQRRTNKNNVAWMGIFHLCGLCIDAKHYQQAQQRHQQHRRRRHHTTSSDVSRDQLTFRFEREKFAPACMRPNKRVCVSPAPAAPTSSIYRFILSTIVASRQFFSLSLSLYRMGCAQRDIVTAMITLTFARATVSEWSECACVTDLETDWENAILNRTYLKDQRVLWH